MGELIITAPTDSGSALQVAYPVEGGVDGSPLLLSGNGVATTTNMIGSSCVYMFSTTTCHIRLSQAGDPATTNDAPIPPGIPVLFQCNTFDRLSAIQMSGQPDGFLWVHALRSE